MIEVSEAEWNREGERRFGEDRMQWRFVCPVCGHEASIADWKEAGAPSGAAAFSCVGRWSGGGDAFGGEPGEGPCNYAGGGLFGVNPVCIKRKHNVFDFAMVESVDPWVEVGGERQ